jgi:hypothetical protein
MSNRLEEPQARHDCLFATRIDHGSTNSMKLHRFASTQIDGLESGAIPPGTSLSDDPKS